MTTDDYQKVKQVFNAALETPPAERRAFVAESCVRQPELLDAVEKLLAAHETSQDLFEAPAIAYVPEILSGDRAGQQIGNYEIIRELGRGGMGAVYLAKRADAEFEQQVALKLIKRGMDTDEILARFRQERQILAELNHPNIARLLEGGTTPDGMPYFVMEYVEGVPIGQYCAERELTTRTRLELFREVCSAVAYAHQNLVVHRDLKPSNILVTTDGKPKLLDFGIAKLISADQDQTQTATKLGAMTPDYASPEQIRGEKITTATDVYSLGKVLSKLLDKQEPLPADLRAILQTALRDEPELRYTSVEQFSEDVDRFLKGLPVTAQVDSLGYRGSKFIGRNRIAVSAGVLAFVLLTAGVGSVIYQGRIAAAERDKARIEASKSERINSFMQTVFGSADPRRLGRELKVADTLDDAVSRAENELAPQPEVLAGVRRTIGNSYCGLGLYDKAEEQLRAALDTHQRLLGDEHLETAKSRRDLAILLRYKGDYENAAGLFDHAIASMRTALPASEEALVQAIVESGTNLFLKGDSGSAVPRLQEAYELSQKVYGETNFYSAVALNMLGLAREYNGDLSGAESLYRRAVAICRALPDENRSECSLILMNLGTNLTTGKQYDEAESVFRESLEKTQTRFGPEHPNTAGVLTHLGRMLMLKGDLSRAETELRQALEIQRKALPPDHADIPQTTSLLGLVLTRQGNPTAGEPLIREALKVRRVILPADHWLIANLESALGECLAKQNRYAEAESAMTTGYEGLKAKLGAQHPRTLEAVHRLIDLYEEWNKPALQEKYVLMSGKAG